MRKVILASSSPRRKQLLEEIGLEFSIHPSEAEEIMSPEMHPSKLVMENAFRKASDVAGHYLKQDCIVIGSDTVVVFRNKVMGKPADPDDARIMLSRLRNQTHQVYSGISIYDCFSTDYIIDYAATDVSMWDFCDSVLEDYLDSGEPFDKAGAYGIQGRGRLLVKGISGCYFNVVGLPVTLLSMNLIRFGINVFKK